MRRFFGLFAAFLAAMVLVIAAYGAGPSQSAPDRADVPAQNN
ncbi:hypothetical protein [Rhizomicrobium electricum]|jgi:hypothetical protein|nr:hypothetical protein [Rhizomicrobium electricum]NIJ50787.1 hypothetical protein [Rhizomicrobium electricum]